MGGFVANRVGSRLMLSLIACLWAVSQLPIFFSTSVVALFISRISLGAFEGPTAPVAQHTAFLWFPDNKRALPSALVDLGGRLGLGIAAPILTWMIYSFGWRSAFYALAAVSVLWAVVWLLVSQQGPYSSYRSQFNDERAIAAEDDESDDPFIPYRRLILNRTWFGSIFCGLGGFWAVALFASWMPLYLDKGVGLNPSDAALVVTAASILSGFAVLGLPMMSHWLAQKGYPSKVARCMFAGAVVSVSGLCLFLTPFVQSVALSVALLAIAVSMPQGIFPLIYLVGGEMNPVRQRAGVIASGVAVITIAGFAAPVLLGTLADMGATPADGYALGFKVSGLLMIFFGLAAGTLMRPKITAQKIGLLRATE